MTNVGPRDDHVGFWFGDRRFKHLSHADALQSLGSEVWICKPDLQYVGPVRLAKVTKAGHCVVLSEYPLSLGAPNWPFCHDSKRWLNHKQGRLLRSTVLTYRLAKFNPEEGDNG